MNWIANANRLSPWSQATVVVAGLAVSGFAAADALLQIGANVVVLDDGDSTAHREKAQLLEFLGATVRLGPGSSGQLPPETDLVVVSPGWRPSYRLLQLANQHQIPIWGEVELAWRLQQPDRYVPWLGVTGTNGKTTTTMMLASMLQAAGLKTAAVGNIGRPILEALLDEEDYDVLAVELSSFQLHYVDSVSLHSAACLNFHEDHLEWYATPADWGPGATSPMTAYRADKAQVFERVQSSCVYNVAEPVTQELVADADVIDGARAIGFTLETPHISMLGVVDGLLVDRAFVPQRFDSALELAKVTDVQPAAPHMVENALAAAALARSFGVPATAVRDGLRNLTIGDHRIQEVTTHGGVTFIDDSKATNPHAAAASFRAFDSIIWVAGGQAKGTSFDDLVAVNRHKLRKAVLLGIDRDLIARALARHAPEVPVIIIDETDTRAIGLAVAAAATGAMAGDTVLFAPGCASKDMWNGYDERGRDFTVAALDWVEHN